MTIIAMGGGGFAMEATPLLDDYVLAAAGRPRPRVLYVPTASGDSSDSIARFYRALGPRCEPRHVELFRRDGTDLRDQAVGADVIYVGGGNTANMLAVWRTQGFDHALREAVAAGVVLAGLSAGAVCWFEGTVTDSFGPLAALRDGLGLVPGILVPHYDSEEQRRPTLHRLIEDGTFDSALAADDGAAFVYRDGELVEIVASRPWASGYRVERTSSGVRETKLATRYLGSPA